MFRELFEAASSKPSPCGISPSPQSRAMYAIDLLLKWNTNNKGAHFIFLSIFNSTFMSHLITLNGKK